MKVVPDRLVQVGSSFEQTYKPVLNFHGWKVAMLRYFDVVAPENFHRVERHWNTNEVFILTAGQADLIVFDGDEQPAQGYVFPMEVNVAPRCDGSGRAYHSIRTERDRARND